MIAPWEVSADWQDPQPQVFTMEGTAYISDPATSTVHAVDITTGEVWATGDLGVVPSELRGATGEADEHAHAGAA